MSKKPCFGIAVGGEIRLRQSVEAQVRARFERELAACTGELQRAEVERKIRHEVRAEMKRVASPYSLWSSP